MADVSNSSEPTAAIDSTSGFGPTHAYVTHGQYCITPLAAMLHPRRPRDSREKMRKIKNNLHNLILRLYPVAVTQLPHMDSDAVRTLATAVGLLSLTYKCPPLLLSGLEERIIKLLEPTATATATVTAAATLSSYGDVADNGRNPKNGDAGTHAPPLAALVMVLNALDRHKARWTIPQRLWDVLFACTSVHDVETLHDALTCYELAKLVEIVARNNQRPPPCSVDNLAGCASIKLHEMSAANLTELVWGFSRLRIKLPITHGDHALEVSGEMAPYMWIKLMHSYAKIPYTPGDVMLDVMTQCIVSAHKRKRSLLPRSLSDLYWSHASLDLRLVYMVHARPASLPAYTYADA